MKRTFIAIPVEATTALKASITLLRRELMMESIKWTEPENLHLTLKFLGDTSDDQINRIAGIISPILSACFTMKFKLMGMNYFSNKGIPSVLFSEIGNADKLGEIALQVNHALEPLGFSREIRLFKSHLTLARIKVLRDLKGFKTHVGKFTGNDFGEVSLDRAIFYESILKPSGPTYYPLEIYPFRTISPFHETH